MAGGVNGLTLGDQETISSSAMPTTTSRQSLSMRILPLLAASLLAAAIAQPAAAAEEQNVVLGGVAATTWSSGNNGKLPVIVFSHGFHGCPIQARTLSAAIADAGYLVIAPQHRDGVCDDDKSRLREPPDQPWGDDELWTDATYRDRAEDVRHIIAALRDDPQWRERADLSHLGLMGHSLGGYTALGLAGAWPSWKLDGVKAVLALSPAIGQFVHHRTLSGLGAPVMYQTGTRDYWVARVVQPPGTAYDMSPAPKYSLVFADASHRAWGEEETAAHRVIFDYARAFLDHYVKGDPADPVLTRREPGVAALRYDSELGTGGDGIAIIDDPPKSLRQRARELLGR
jgi:dienelactone hydrolase